MMSKTFERFLRSLTDDELATFARERARVQPPYWRYLQLALRIEADRRGLRLAEELVGPAAPSSVETEMHTGTA